MGLIFNLTLLALLGVACNAGNFGTSIAVTSGTLYKLPKTLGTGDLISAMGLYKAYPNRYTKYTLNILDNKGNILLQVDFRSGQNLLILNARSRGRWGAEVRSKFNAKQNVKVGRKFLLKVKVEANSYLIYLDRTLVGEFAHRQGLPKYNSAAKIQLKNDPYGTAVFTTLLPVSTTI